MAPFLKETIHNLVISLEIEINFCGIWSGNALPLNVMFFPSVHLCYKGTTPLNYCAVCIVHLLENLPLNIVQERPLLPRPEHLLGEAPLHRLHPLTARPAAARYAVRTNQIPDSQRKVVFITTHTVPKVM